MYDIDVFSLNARNGSDFKFTIKITEMYVGGQSIAIQVIWLKYQFKVRILNLFASLIQANVRVLPQSQLITD